MAGLTDKVSVDNSDFESVGEILGRLAYEHAQRTKAAPTWRAVNWLVIVAVTLLVIDAGIWFLIVRAGAVFIPPAADYVAYRDAASSWLGGGPFYHPYQLAGPYTIVGTSPEPILYPPTEVLILAPFTVLPAFAWWAPVLIVGYVVWKAPRDRQLLCLGLALWPQSIGMVVVGNPGMWVVATLALATIRPGFAPWILLKPTLFPFAMYRIRERGWWIGLLILGILSWTFLPLWFEWFTALRNSDGSILYSLSNVPPMLIPVVAVWRR